MSQLGNREEEQQQQQQVLRMSVVKEREIANDPADRLIHLLFHLSACV